MSLDRLILFQKAYLRRRPCSPLPINDPQQDAQVLVLHGRSGIQQVVGELQVGRGDDQSGDQGDERAWGRQPRLADRPVATAPGVAREGRQRCRRRGQVVHDADPRRPHVLQQPAREDRGGRGDLGGDRDLCYELTVLARAAIFTDAFTESASVQKLSGARGAKKSPKKSATARKRAAKTPAAA